MKIPEPSLLNADIKIGEFYYCTNRPSDACRSMWVIMVTGFRRAKTANSLIGWDCDILELHGNNPVPSVHSGWFTSPEYTLHIQTHWRLATDHERKMFLLVSMR